MSRLKDPALGWMPYVWLIFLAYLFIAPAFGGGALEWTLTLASIAVFLPLYLGQFHGSRSRAFRLNVAVAALGFALIPINPGANTYVIFAAAGAGFALAPRRAFLYLLALVAVLAAEMLVLPIEVRNWMGVPTMLLIMTIGGMNIYSAEGYRQGARLQRAQEEVEEMATLAERERIARDLHDLLGHTLSVIVLKSELASKLAGHDAAGAVREIREVEQVSRSALTEVRRAVEGYQQHGLKGELRSAARVLDAAGVTLQTDIAPLDLPPRQEAALAMAVREAMTNVIRHAGATHCSVRLHGDGRGAVLTIEDDGRGGAMAEGNGLAGMRARIVALGGSVQAAPSAGGATGGFRLAITLPVAPPYAGAVS